MTCEICGRPEDACPACDIRTGVVAELDCLRIGYERQKARADEADADAAYHLDSSRALAEVAAGAQNEVTNLRRELELQKERADLSETRAREAEERLATFDDESPVPVPCPRCEIRGGHLQGCPNGAPP